MFLKRIIKKKIIPSLYCTPVSNNLKLKLLNYEQPEIVLKINLNEINQFLQNSHLENIFAPHKIKKTYVPGFIWTGEWDLKSKPIDKYYEYSVSYRSIFQIFKDGRHYNDCDEYKMKAAQIRNNIFSVRGQSIEELNRYFESLIFLKNTIEKNGYLSQRDLNQKKTDDEIGVFIDRYGNLIKAEDDFSGTHRFAIAKLLKLPFVYVNLVAVHRIWAEQNLDYLIHRQDKLQPKFLLNIEE